MKVGDFATLVVERTRKDGALLDWGQEEPLFLPVEEQYGEVRRDDKVVVHITRDDRVYSRPMATMRLDDYFELDTSSLSVGQKVDLIIFDVSDLGFDAVIDNAYRGVLYHNEVFAELDYGDQIVGYIKKVRDDGKVDLMSQPRGTHGTTDLGRVILRKLEEADGFLPLTDKSPPEEIYDLFGVSKKKFKMAIGRLYKHRDITIDSDGIRRS